MKRQKPITRFKSDLTVLRNQPHRHWHYVYKQRRKRLITDDVSTWQIIAGQLFTVVASVAAGYILDIQKENIGLLVGAYVLMPGVVDLSASLTGAMAAKINHLIDKTPAKPFTVAFHSVGFSLMIGLFAGVIVGLFGGIMSSVLFDGNIIQLTLLGMLSMTTISLMGDPVIAFMTVGFKKANINPDNVVGPIQSSLIDVLAILVIAMYARILS